MTVAPVRMSPADVADRLFGVDMWETPREILASVFSPSSRTAVKACHASSKTHTAAVAVALTLYEGGDVLTTAPTWEQVKTVLWGEVHRLLMGSVIPLSEWGAINQTEIIMPDGSHALGLSTNEGVRFQGWHARPESFLLVIKDEAPGVRPDIYEAVEGISAGGDVRRLLLGNPVIASGPFYDLYAGADPGWRRFTIDAFDTPNLAGLTLESLLMLPDHELDINERPYLVTRRWVRDRYYEWGPDHPLWQSRVRGQFPLQADDALISLAWLERGNHRKVWDEQGALLVAGVDVAGPGEDETVLCVQQDGHVLYLEAFAQPDARGPVLAALKDWLHKGVARVNVDEAGNGWYFTQHFKESLPQSVTVSGINVGEAPTSSVAAEQFVNLKAEMYWSLRERFRDGLISGITDQLAISQLAGLRYQHDARGRIKIESKEDARKRGVKSPDRAEAVMLAFAPRNWVDDLAEAMGQGMSWSGSRAPVRHAARGSARGRR